MPLEENVQSAAPQVKTKAVKAGAGAGKTYNLTRDVAAFAKSFYKTHERWPRVVVTTFTKKATQELSERILQLALKEEPEILPFVNSGYYLQVSTIHGILDRLLKECGSHLGLRRDFSYLSNSEALFLSKKVLKSILDEEESFTDLTRHYSFAQLHTLLSEAEELPLEGYTFVSKDDAYRLLREYLEAARSRTSGILQQLKNEQLTDKWRSVVDVLYEVVPLLDIENWAENQKRIVERMDLIKLNGLKPRKDGSLLDMYDDFKSCVDQLRKFEEPYYSEECIDLAGKYNGQFSLLLSKYKDRLQEQKKAVNKIEISDLEVLAQQLILRHKKEVDKHAAAFDYWVIDEFQDTSPLQLELLTSLIGKSPYYLVGDPQQSIYLFRGARAEVFASAVEAIRKNNGDFVELTDNYRSEKKMLGMINHLTAGLGSAFSPMQPTQADTWSEYALYLQPGCEAERELEYMYRHLQRLFAKGATFASVAVLVRKNEQLKAVGEFLSAKRLPAHLSSSGQFWRRREVLDCVILLKFLLNPHDEVNLVSFLRSPFLEVSDEDIAGWVQETAPLWSHLLTLKNSSATVQLLVSLLVVSEERGYVYGFQAALEKLGFFDNHLVYDPSGRSEGNVWMFIHKLKTFEATASGTFYDFISECEKSEYLESTSDAPGSIDNNKISVMTIHAAKGLQFEHVLMPYLADEQYIENTKNFLVDEVRKKWCIRTPRSETELATSSSLYEKDILAYYKTRLQEEDLRLFYVAITRAVKTIYLSWCEKIKTRSWTRLLSHLSSTPGVHTLGESQYSVYPAEITAEFDSADTQPLIDVPEMFRTKEHKEVTHAVTELVEIKSFRQTEANFYKIRLGILFHRLLEVLAKPVQIDLRATIQAWFGEDAEKVADALNYILQLEKPPLSRLLKEGKPEWSFLNKDGDSFIQGQIDLWGIVDGTLWVVDYKSGGFVEESQLLSQLSAYGNALQKYLKWQGPVQLAVVYPFQKKFIVK